MVQPAALHPKPSSVPLWYAKKPNSKNTTTATAASASASAAALSSNSSASLPTSAAAVVYHWIYGTVIVALLVRAILCWSPSSSSSSSYSTPSFVFLENSIASSLRDFSGMAAKHRTNRVRQARQQQQRQRPYRTVKVLHGIFTEDTSQDEAYRIQHRKLFAIWNDRRVCTLYDYEQQMDSVQRDQCEFIYTFVMGSNPTGPTILLHNESVPWVVAHGTVTGKSSDLNEPDIRHLNIQDNKNEGKTPSWLAYASSLASSSTLAIDYITKSDIDTVVMLHEFFRFAYWHMPPAPFNHLAVQCPPMNTYHFTAFAPRDDFQDKYYNDLFTYCSGELYTLSTSLATAVTKEARRWNGVCPYCSGYEAIDLFDTIHRTHPFKLTFVSAKLQFWWTHVPMDDHDSSRGWPIILAREQSRMQGIAYDGQNWTTKSTYHDMLLEPELQFTHIH